MLIELNYASYLSRQSNEAEDNNIHFKLKKDNMSKKKITPADNQANQGNANKGTSGTNKQNSQVHGNRSKQVQATKTKTKKR